MRLVAESIVLVDDNDNSPALRYESIPSGRIASVQEFIRRTQRKFPPCGPRGKYARSTSRPDGVKVGTVQKVVSANTELLGRH